MSEIFIEKTNRILFVFIKKLLLKNHRAIYKNDIIDDTNDILQESWRLFCENYPQFFENESITRGLLFTIAKREVYYFANQKSKLNEKVIEIHSKQKMEIEEQVYDVFVHEDIEKILKKLPAKYVFILKYLQNDANNKDENSFFERISNDYKNTFGSILTLQNYRTLKNRAKRKFLELVLNEAY